MANYRILEASGETAPIDQGERDTLMRHGAKNEFLDITTLIRSIQRAEGNPDCFGKAIGYCDRTDCAWREYCLLRR